MSLFAELKRRNVIRVATAYAVTAWLVIQVVETIFPVFGFSDETVRYVVIVLGIGFVPAVIGAWLLQVTPEGIRVDRGVADNAPASERAKRLLDRAIIVVLALGISYFAYDKFVLAPERLVVAEAEAEAQGRADAVSGFYGDRSIAVLPFNNMSGDPEQQYIADGVAEEVLNLLAHIRDLRVISRSSAFAYRDQDLEIAEIAKRLNVAHILEGSIRRAGDTIRVTAQLIEARSDTHLWSETYERELDNVFQVQDEIAADVVENLKIELLRPLPRSRHVDPEVYALTAEAMRVWQTRPDGVGPKMYELLSRALEIDPDYVPALDLLVAAYWYGAADAHELSEEEFDKLIWDIYDRIEEIDPSYASADYVRAFDYSFDNQLEEAADAYLQALSKDMSLADNVRIAAIFARKIGRFSVAQELLRYTLAIDPLCHRCRLAYGSTLLYAGEYGRAQEETERYQLIAHGGYSTRVQAMLLQGDAEAVIAYADSADLDDGPDKIILSAAKAMALYSLGANEEAESLFAELSEMPTDDSRARLLEITIAAAWMGKNDLAFENLYAMSATNFRALRNRVLSPVWQGLHDDPRWAEWRESDGMSAERLAAIEFDPDLPE